MTVESDHAWLEYVYRWVFQPDFGGNPIVKQPGGSETWSGKVVTSGDVRVVIRVGGSDMVVASRIYVKPRAWAWGAGNGMTLESGTLPWPSGSQSIGRVCRPNHCPQGSVVQPSGGFQDGVGYDIGTVAGGPNDGLRYIDNVTMDVHMVGLVNPDYLAGGSQYPATGADAVACGSSSSDTIPVSFVEYNEGCRFQPSYLVPFESWAWNHETEHMTNAVQAVGQVPQWNAPLQLEGLVGRATLDVESDATEALENIPECVQQVATTHTVGNFPGTPVDIWTWSGTVFQERSQAFKPWDPQSWHPMTAPCLL